MKAEVTSDSKWVSMWLFAGMVMVIVQIMLGGATRLTGSGLSITRWEIVTGTLPPLNEREWDIAFNLYKETPQYKKINNGIEMARFKYIFYWEYFHRLWARTMGFVFLFPFFYFLIKRQLSIVTIKRLMVVVALAATAASFGWIMVASGLKDRPWVNAYKLTVHLSLGIGLFLYLFYTWYANKGITYLSVSRKWRSAVEGLIILVFIQICFGGFVSGMKSALNYPTWPTMNGEWVPAIISDTSHWNIDSLLLYDKSGFMPAFVQVIHRYLAYVILIFVLVFAFKWYRSQQRNLYWLSYSLVGIIVVQVLLGILTLLGSHGSIPVVFGVLHQGVGILLLTTLTYIRIRTRVN